MMNSYCKPIRGQEDWLAARSYFENVVDPDLIDHAIYTIEAAEESICTY